ncbi:MAG: hypothetical protein DYG84_14445 [Candidatus Brocadia sp. AMX3]|nr:hypothetical protein [Candidatus Brocadia sp. AMX3]
MKFLSVKFGWVLKDEDPTTFRYIANAMINNPLAPFIKGNIHPLPPASGGQGSPPYQRGIQGVVWYAMIQD